jgi:hypothetical protein
LIIKFVFGRKINLTLERIVMNDRYDIDRTLESLLVEKKKKESLSLLGDEDGKIVSIIEDVINPDRKDDS